ncbi:MAG TPA: RNA methyltransferase [Nitrososphaerales archaeon]|nr:RNA methyltransferase [Nitrososphaerales archaeon]
MASKLTKLSELRSHTSKKPGALSHFTVAIVEPEFGINLGYLARTAANFGMKRLVVVSRRKLGKEKLSQARLFAAHGRELIESLEYSTSVRSLKKRFKSLVGTTAIEAKRKSNLTRRTLGLEECAHSVMSQLKDRSGRRIDACFVFGRDTTGLTNEELRECDYTLTIRTLSDYNTLNVSHAAAIVFYAFIRASGSNGSPREGVKRSLVSPSLSSRRERERVVTLFLKLAEDSEFQPFKEKLLRETLERVLNRSDPTLRELYLLMGLASKADSKIRRLSD